MDHDCDRDEPHGRVVLRLIAFAAAVLRCPDAPTADDVVAAADVFAWFLTGPHPAAHLILTAADPTDQVTGETQPTQRKGTAMQLKDSQQVDLTVEAVDAKGQEVLGDTITWTAADSTGAASTAVTLVPSADTMTVTVVAQTEAVGVVVTATDANGLTVTDSVDVIAGTATALKVTEGTPVDQPAAP